MITKTEYVTFEGIAYWAKLYKPDEFRGAERWTMNLYLSPEGIEKYKKLGIQKKLNTNDLGTYFSPQRPTSKMIANKLVYFTAPVIYDKDGSILVGYYTDDKLVRTYENKDQKIVQKGEGVLIGNGSKVAVTLSVYPTKMGIGNRLESVKILDLITYEPNQEDESPATETEKALDDKIVW